MYVVYCLTTVPLHSAAFSNFKGNRALVTWNLFRAEKTLQISRKREAFFWFFEQRENCFKLLKPCSKYFFFFWQLVEFCWDRSTLKYEKITAEVVSGCCILEFILFYTRQVTCNARQKEDIHITSCIALCNDDVWRHNIQFFGNKIARRHVEENVA